MKEKEMPNVEVQNLNGQPLPDKRPPRKHRKQEKQYQAVMLSLANSFFEYVEKETDDELLEMKLDQLDGTWKIFVHKWNKNPKSLWKLRPGDFLKFIDDQITKLKEDEKENKEEKGKVIRLPGTMS
jgi:hypothetical protein